MYVVEPTISREPGKNVLDIGDLDQYHKFILGERSPAIAKARAGSGVSTASAFAAGASAGGGGEEKDDSSAVAAVGINVDTNLPVMQRKAFEWRSQGGATYICVRITMDGTSPGK